MQLVSSFRGTERYSIEQPIGSGGFGIVYRASDRVRGEQVALKVLRNFDGARLYSFKREFRALADVAHPNLVSLYELASDHEDWFFTMELVEGRSFLEWVCPNGVARHEQEVKTTELGKRAAADGTERDDGTVRLARAHFDEARLRSSFAQLVEGVRALHRSGHLHRDLKPSNALVTEKGRVVLLDFGLVTDIGPEGSVDERIVGSVPYMSPEQGFAERIGPASDYYAVGVMMYEALTGRWPHMGKLYELLVAKRSQDPAPPAAVAEVPSDLSDLCMDLLARDPARRPSAEEVLRRLGAESAVVAPAGASDRASAALVGRRDEIAQLAHAFPTSNEGKPVVVFVHGGSGMGKTALVTELGRKLKVERGVTVLRGACYERESVPYKALDSLMDALSSHLRKLPRLLAERLMPREVKALARLFPVLDRVESIAGFPQRAGEVAELEALRRRAITALRDLLGRMRDQQPLLVVIDDVQWGDSDSARLLRDLLSEDCPPVMFLFCYRTEERHDGEFIDLLREALERQHSATVSEVEVGPLGDEAARELAAALLGAATIEDADRERLARQVARESGGNPFFIQQIAGYLCEEDAVTISSGTHIGLADVLRHRLRALDPATTTLLETVAVAGRPIPESVAGAAAGLGETRQEVLALRHAHLVRTSWQAGATQLAAYHDRIREAVLGTIEPERLPVLHRALAETLERAGSADAEAVSEHFHRAGDPERAGVHAERAAGEAFRKLAFDRAARLYERALALRTVPRHERSRIAERLGEALAHAGRGPAAARAYLDAVDGADARHAVHLRCRAAEQYFFSGHIDQGTDLFHEVLEAAGLPPLPKTEVRALAGFARRRIELKVRGLGFELRDERSVDPDALVRTDVCYSVAAVLGGIRPLAASSLQTHHLLLALRLGEPYRVVRGLGVEAAFTAMAGASASGRTMELLERAADVASRVDRPDALGLVTAIEGIAAYFLGAWRRSRDKLREAETILSERCPALSFELGQVRCFLSLAMFYMGAFAEAGHRVLPVLGDVRERGDRYAESILVNVTYRYYLLRDDVDAARAEVARGLSGWYRGGVTVQDFYELAAQVRMALYCGEGARAWEICDAGHGAIARSPLGRMQIIRVELGQLRGQAAVLRASQDTGRRADRWLREADDEARKIEREEGAWCRPLALVLRAAVEAQRGQRDRAAALLADAERFCRAEDMVGFAEAAAWRRGKLVSNHELVGQAEAWMATQGIKSPQRFATLLAPGFDASTNR
jgi:eukaryotic-like serine/threonine-protein kinase